MKFKKTTYIILGTIALCLVLAVVLPPAMATRNDNPTWAPVQQVDITIRDTATVTENVAVAPTIVFNYVPSDMLQQVQIVQTDSDILRIQTNAVLHPLISITHNNIEGPVIVIEENEDAVRSAYRTSASLLGITNATGSPLMVVYLPRTGINRIVLNNQEAILTNSGPTTPTLVSAPSVTFR